MKFKNEQTFQQHAKKNYDSIKKVDKTIPDFDTFDFTGLESEYKTYKKPEVIFIPRGLTQDQWGKKFNYWYSSYIPNNFLKGSGWDVTVIEASPKGTKNNISKEQAEREDFPLCSMEAYLSLQWLLLTQKREPVDKETWTIVKENIEVHEAVCSVFESWYPGYRQVCSDYDYRDRASDVGVVRASGERAPRDLVLDSSSNSSELKQNTAAILELNETLKGIFKWK